MKGNKLNYFLYVVVLLFYIWAFYNSISTQKEYAMNIEKNIGYAIGGYVRTAVNRSIRATTYYNYINFKIDNRDYHDITIKGITYGSLDAKKGDQFLVIYDKLDPEICQMLFDYPVKDSTDFKRYLNGFKKTPLDVGRYFAY